MELYHSNVRGQIYEYTSSQSSCLARYLSSLVGINKTQFPQFHHDSWYQISNILSAIYNAPVKYHTILYQNFKPEFFDIEVKRYSQKLIEKLKEDTNSSISVTLNSYTADENTLAYLTPFHGDSCCTRQIAVHEFPVLDIRYTSMFTFQNEVILPPFLRIDTGFILPIPISEYPTADLEACSKRKNSDMYFNRWSTIQNKECLDKRVQTIAKIDRQFSVIKAICVDRNVITILNDILLKFYSEYPECNINQKHGPLHICDTITISMILYLDYVEQKSIDILDSSVKYNIVNLVFAAAFHDAGRKCIDGIDLWEKESSILAREYLSTKNLSTNRVNDIIQIMDDEDSILHLIMKGADSIDISRVQSYNVKYNPLFTAPQYDVYDKTLISDNTLVLEFANVYMLIYFIQRKIKEKREELEIELTEKADVKRRLYDEILDGNYSFVKGVDGTYTFKIKMEELTIFETYTLPNTQYVDATKFDIAEVMSYINDTPPGLSDKEAAKQRLDNYKLALKSSKTPSGIRRYINELADDIVGFNESIISMCNYFTSTHFQNNDRFFDDYWEVLLCFLSVLPNSLRHLSKVIMPFQIKNLYK